MLKKHDLCRTPSEELLHRFRSANAIEVPKTTFATHIDWMLRSLLKASPETKEMKLNFVDGRSLQIDAGFFDDTWRVHDKWLTYDGAHGDTFCDETDGEHSKVFACDHAVLQLWDTMIAQLKSAGKHPRISTAEPWLKSMARGRLSQMPRAIECVQCVHKETLRVYWTSVDSHHHKDKEVNITLHREDCAGSPKKTQQRPERYE